jgi:hypothetical protein
VSPPSTGEKRAGINYEDKIRELEAKLFGKWLIFHKISIVH